MFDIAVSVFGEEIVIFVEVCKKNKVWGVFFLMGEKYE